MANYTLNYTGEKVDELLNKIDTAFGETTTAILVDNQTVTLGEGTGMITGFSVEESKTYTVIYNGVEYADLMGDVVDFGGGATPYIGNAGLLTGGGDSTIPFLIMTQQGMTAIADFSGIESCTITIIGEGIKTIDAKYLPKISVNIASLETDNDSMMNIENVSYTPLYNHFLKGGDVEFVISADDGSSAVYRAMSCQLISSNNDCRFGFINSFTGQIIQACFTTP